MIWPRRPPAMPTSKTSFDPMLATIETVLLLLSVLVAVAIAARRLNIAPSILLVIAGVGMALIPGLPRIELAPELVLLGMLPPLIYSAGVAMSWREFRFNLRPIALLAVGCVVFTACAVALAVNWLLGMPFAVAFVLGAIVAPPDVVAPLADRAPRSACRGGCWSCWKARAWPTTPPPSSSTASPSPQSSPGCSRFRKPAGHSS